MTTALDIIKRSMRLIGVYALGEEPTAVEAADGLYALNTLVQSMGNESLLIFAPTMDEIAISASQQTVTLGPTGSTVTDRPIKFLDSSYVNIGDISYPLTIETTTDYNLIANKSQSAGIPSVVYAVMTVPDVTVYLWPLLGQDATLFLASQKRLANFPTLTTVVSLPDGYERMLAFCLAAEIAPEYNVEASATVMRVAANTKRILKRTNLQVPILGMPSGLPLNVGWGGGALIGPTADIILTEDGQYIELE